MRLKNVTFDNWLLSHAHKHPKERWLRELYPWPIFARIDCDPRLVGLPQRFHYDGVEYQVTLKSACWQPGHATYRYRVFLESEGLGWHARSFSDTFDLCATKEGSFVTVFHTAKEEALEKIARAFFQRRWRSLKPELFRNLAVSRFLSASVVAEVADAAFHDLNLTHYPEAGLLSDNGPIFGAANGTWVGYRFFSEHAYEWARHSAREGRRVIALYFADTKYQFKTDLPKGAQVWSIANLDATRLNRRYEEFIWVLLRNLEIPQPVVAREELEAIVRGKETATLPPITEADVSEALAALKCPCQTKAELRYQLAAAVLLNAWIEAERQCGFPQRKKFYAFKEKVNQLVEWAMRSGLPQVQVWAENSPHRRGFILYVRIDGVDFSFHAIPLAEQLSKTGGPHPAWTGVRLKPIAPLVLAWARAHRQAGTPTEASPADTVGSPAVGAPASSTSTQPSPA